MLINSPTQIALTHHLDDEISKKISVAINTEAAERLTNPVIPLKLTKKGYQIALLEKDVDHLTCENKNLVTQNGQ